MSNRSNSIGWGILAYFTSFFVTLWIVGELFDWNLTDDSRLCLRLTYLVDVAVSILVYRRSA